MSARSTAWIVGVLKEHEYAAGVGPGSICACGFIPTVSPTSLASLQEYHREHVAEAIGAQVREERRQAWEEGVEAAYYDPEVRGFIACGENPYWIEVRD